MSLTLPQLLVKAEILHLRRQMAALRSLRPEERFEVHDVADSVTLASSTACGRKLNHTSGLGMFGPVTAKHLTDIEGVYTSTGLPPELDICELARPATFDMLSDYAVTGTIDTFYRPFEDSKSVDKPLDPAETNINVEQTTDMATFVSFSVTGFQSSGRSPALLGILAQSAANRPDTALFFAKIDGQIAGCAGIAFLDDTSVANLYIDSTVPAFRGKGVHAALIRARIEVARRKGCRGVVASARAGSASARNLERAGMGRVFSSRTYTKKDG